MSPIMVEKNTLTGGRSWVLVRKENQKGPNNNRFQVADIRQLPEGYYVVFCTHPYCPWCERGRTLDEISIQVSKHRKEKHP